MKWLNFDLEFPQCYRKPHKVWWYFKLVLFWVGGNNGMALKPFLTLKSSSDETIFVCRSMCI